MSQVGRKKTTHVKAEYAQDENGAWTVICKVDDERAVATYGETKDDAEDNLNNALNDLAEKGENFYVEVVTQ